MPERPLIDVRERPLQLTNLLSQAGKPLNLRRLTVAAVPMSMGRPHVLQSEAASAGRDLRDQIFIISSVVDLRRHDLQLDVQATVGESNRKPALRAIAAVPRHSDHHKRKGFSWMRSLPATTQSIHWAEYWSLGVEKEALERKRRVARACGILDNRARRGGSFRPSFHRQRI